jgi:hypothetical protein
MICAIHQPHYLPWGRYFQKIIQADVFVILDDVNFTKNGWQNRNKIKTPNGAQLLTVPVVHRFGQKINDVELNYQTGWVKKHVLGIKQAYSKAPFFDQLFPEFLEILEKEDHFLANLNIEILRWQLDYIECTTPMVRSSQLGIKSQGTHRIVDIVKAVDCDQYLSGAYALEEYMDSEHFEDNDIQLIIQKWIAKEYPQLHGKHGFIKDLAVFDMLMNLGAGARQLLL